ncbi:predicted protein [Scheffersomyces stipitis CBS 6054]|uniref:DUF1479 domain protein n=1 Tax=Scheffersomyces stipitis (strain ATCC 58785 / CBS 6054 / NBRC 10063 / NRRL Y-11545) TaxID=322104 RepID=A3LWZ1_PICST|nr:predicted protein [Scheffersomyces stipitis CBS 6054]ABN67715.2 predicted protein [Scheffersomyces stipitis CBS 6054]
MTPTKVVTTTEPPDLENRFIDIKRSLVSPENIEKVTQSWKRLLRALEKQADTISEEGPKYVPQVDFKDIVANNNQLPDNVSALFKERGTLMIHNVVDEEQIDTWFNELVGFCKEHPETAGYTYPNPTAWYNVFWSKPQSEARFHPNTRALFKAMANQFHVENEDSLIDINTQVVYGDRIRIREPGSVASLKLHLDSSSIERWEDEHYRQAYHEILEGNWEEWDAFRLDERTYANENLYEHVLTGKSTICSAFRTLQGWLALSNNKSGEGTLRVLPNLKMAMAYIILRPLFWRDPVSGDIDDYEIDLETPKFPGSVPSTGQLFLPEEYFPHLYHQKSVISIPDVRKGTFVFWHVDIPHEVDKEHNGEGHSSVFYYGQTPLSITNIRTILDTKKAFLNNKSPEDYSSQLSETEKAKEYQGADINHIKNIEGMRSMGLEPFDVNEPFLTKGQREVRALANEALKAGTFDPHS